MRPFRSVLAALLPALLAGGCAAPLADTPYQRIVKPRPGAGPRFVRVEAAAEPNPRSVVSPSEPGPRMVRAAACEALGLTPFPCATLPKEKPAYVLRLTYYVREAWPRRAAGGTGPGILRSVQSGGGVFGEHDPPQDAAHEIVWRFTLARAEEGGEVLFRSGAFRREIQFWRFDVTYWLERYFSE